MVFFSIIIIKCTHLFLTSIPHYCGELDLATNYRKATCLESYLTPVMNDFFFFWTADHQYFSSVLLSFNTLVSDHKLLPRSLLNWCMNTALWYRYWRIIFTELIEWKSERDTQTFVHKVEKKSLNRKLFLYFATNELTQETFELVLFNCLVLSVVKRSSLLGWLELFH